MKKSINFARTPKLNTVQNVGIEISRLYRRTKRGEITTPDGYRMVQMLAVLKQCLETSEIERKIAELEDAIAQQRDNVTHLRPKVIA
jgi:hypothetical protein